MKKFISVLLSSAMLTGLLTACGSSDSSASSESSSKDDKSYVSTLEDGQYYVRDKQNNCTPVWFGNATFDEGSSVPTTPDDKRVVWYKDDFEKIPTLYSGDSLIMYTTDVIDENIVFERFEIFDYTIGLCGMEELDSGRYLISTDKEKRCTYPGGDTDEILKLNNTSVILESIGGEPVRASKEETAETFLTRSGTLKGLREGELYPVEIYEGTIYHNYKFKADVLAMGSMETIKTHDYTFETESLINITIPEFFKTGYYMINGKGLFRYVKGDSYNQTTDFNSRNEDPGLEDIVFYSIEDLNNAAKSKEEQIASLKATDAETSRTFTVKSPGTITVIVTFTIPGSYPYKEGLPDVTAVIETPSGKQIPMANAEDGSVLKSFNADVVGEYTIWLYNLEGRTASLKIQ